MDKKAFRERVGSDIGVIRSLLLFMLLLLIASCSDDIIPPPNIDPVPIDETPAWSPDGQWICYTHTSLDPNDTTYPTGLYTIDTSGAQRKLVIEGQALNPSWSPDGSRITFSNGRIYTIKPNGDSLTQVTDVSGFCPAYSPDGLEIAFDTPFNDNGGASVIWLVDVNTKELFDISKHGVGEWRMPSWSPDGEYIIHQRYIGIGAPELFRMQRDGSNPLRLTFNGYFDGYPRYSPDGKKIMWSISFNGQNNIWLMNSDGSNQHFLVDGSSAAFDFDSFSIVVSRPDYTHQRLVLWKTNINGTGLRQITQ